MNTYQIEWTEYLRTGNIRIPDNLEVLCSGSLPIKAVSETEAALLFKQAFPKCWINTPLSG